MSNTSQSTVLDQVDRIVAALWFHEALAAVMIVAIAAAGTEFIKRGVRQHTTLTDDWTPRAVALAIGFLLTPVVWPEGSDWNPWVMGLFLTLIAPVVYPVVMKMAKREGK